MPPKNKNKRFLAQQKALEEAKAAKDAAKAAVVEGDDAGTKRPTAEELGFFVRTGPDAAMRANAEMNIIVDNIQLFGGKTELVQFGTLHLTYGMHYGLVGRNGVGKSCMLRAIAEKVIKLPEHLHIIHVEQECVGDQRTALETVVGVDKERSWLIELEQRMMDLNIDEERGITLSEVYERLGDLDSDTAMSRAATILSGLGFDTDMQNQPTREFSGGWRMRIALAQALFLKPDLLLLDEPTNHLDVHALTWLEEFLSTWERTVVIVSHDRGFLNKTTNRTIFLHRKRLMYYGGNYDTFLKVRAEHRANQQATQKTQNQRASHLKQFIMRFGQGHKKMVRQAQCRMKMLAKLQEEAVEVDYDDPYLRLDFPSASALPPPCISVMGVSFGYEEGKTLYEGLEFGLDMDSRVAIVGPNGAGKSTFLNLMLGQIVPTEGWVNRHTKLRLAYFSQHHIDMMDLEADAVTHMRRLDKDVSVEEARKYLGRFGLGGDHALQKVETLSGGQKSRLAFAELAWRQPHILLLDEPTNHLDVETIEAMAMALNKFDGGVVLVSHDERLISLVCDEIWCVNKFEKRKDGSYKPGTVTVFEGSFDEYKEQLTKEFEEKDLIKTKNLRAQLRQ